MKDNSGNGYKPMTDKQKSYIQRLLFEKGIEEGHRRYVRDALKNGLSSSQASGIIDFLKNLIQCKNFLDAGRDSAPADILKKPRFEDAHSRDIGERESKVIGGYGKRI